MPQKKKITSLQQIVDLPDDTVFWYKGSQYLMKSKKSRTLWTLLPNIYEYRFGMIEFYFRQGRLFYQTNKK